MKNFLKAVLSRAIGTLLGWLAFVVVIAIAVNFMSRNYQSGNEPITSNSILHLRIKGTMRDKLHSMNIESLLGSHDRGMGLYEMTLAIDAAKNDSRFKGIYLDIRPFEAGWADLQSLHKALEDFAKSKKFIYAYADAYSEKSYYLATAADKIFVEPNGEVEMNGLSMNEMFLKGLLDKLDVQPRIFRVGKFKAAIEPLILDKMSIENRAQNQMLLHDIWSENRKQISAVSQKSPEQIDQLVNDLKIGSAKSAKEYGLVHQLAFEDEVVELLKAKTVGKDHELKIVGPMHLLKDQSQKKPSLLKSKNKIALIFAEGEISVGESGPESIGAESIVADLEDAAEDKEVKAIVLRINSPGGDALAADVIWREIEKVDKKIPIIVSMGNVAASGGYYMAAASRYIFAEPTTITGSIGVFGIMANTEKFFKNKLGVSFDGVVTHQHADIGNSNRPMTETESKFIQSSVERVYARFLDVVRQGRNFKDIKEVAEIAEGRVWSGTKAKEVGLVDELGGLSTAIEKTALIAKLTKPYRIEIYPKDEERFFQLFERYFGDSLEEYLSLKVSASTLSLLQNLRGRSELLKSGVYTRMISVPRID
jgi:protease-4